MVRLPAKIRLSEDGIVLREWEDGDLAAMAKLFDDPQVAHWTPLASPFDLEAARAYLKSAAQKRAAGERVQLAITVDGKEPAGEVLLMLNGADPEVADLGYSVGAAWRGRGLASRALRMMTEFALGTAGLSRLLLKIEAENTASTGVARAAGYRLTDAPPIPAEGKAGRRLLLQTWEYQGA
ncbi:RimJ/RimL family protein N-acetyltransferase [Streptosporangium becharense]|uniref:RimJ/RimL family protein N-acetyltransferase n=1 Tax=Streptosporangium becharense TaxID=1816182 RepID=A0A7W9MF90_9ACTN|nr:RimJ/RimL family protein N-acetyltransferase [Streptosporangium becharense]MBB5818246.1 RimJ/RimL family protein N-acetyltransferase [Streptosporangium becharense]